MTIKIINPNPRIFATKKISINHTLNKNNHAEIDIECDGELPEVKEILTNILNTL